MFAKFTKFTKFNPILPSICIIAGAGLYTKRKLADSRQQRELKNTAESVRVSSIVYCDSAIVRNLKSYRKDESLCSDDECRKIFDLLNKHYPSVREYEKKALAASLIENNMYASDIGMPKYSTVVRTVDGVESVTADPRNLGDMYFRFEGADSFGSAMIYDMHPVGTAVEWNITL
jgi:hypothetical protein